jgi:hypothetical protein
MSGFIGAGLQSISAVRVAERACPAVLKSKMLLLWTGGISENSLLSDIGSDVITVSGKDFSSTFLPADSTATLNMPDIAAYRTADTDHLWFTEAGVQRNVTVAELIGYDFERTVVCYSSTSPHNILWIGLLQDDATLSEAEINLLHRAFRLHIFWSGTWNDYGYFKDNRGLEQLPWAA